MITPNGAVHAPAPGVTDLKRGNIMSRVLLPVLGAILGAVGFAASAMGAPLVCTAAGPSELLQLNNQSLRAELQARLDRNAALAEAQDVIYSTAPTYNLAAEAAAHCSIAVGYMRSRTRDAETINRCDCLDRLAAYQPPPPPTCPATHEVIVYFSTAVWDLGADDVAALSHAAAEAGRCGLESAIVAGHTDRVGSEDANMRLSQRRAAQVADFLVGEGVDPARIEQQAFGESQLAVQTDDDVAEQANRRTEVRIRFLSDANM